MIRSPIHFSGNKKRALLNGLLELVRPEGNGILFDTMVGGGSVLYAGGTRLSVGIDIDPHLIALHRAFVDRGFASLVEDLFYVFFMKNGESVTDSEYYEFRDKVNKFARSPYYTNSFWAAGITILTQLSYNSLWRFNKKGEYNVPYGHGQKAFDIQRVKDACQHADDMQFQFFHSVPPHSIVGTSDDDVYYYDPPYLQAKYVYGGWDKNRERWLREDIVSFAAEGRQVVLSNVAMYRRETNVSLLEWARQHKLNVYSIANVDYNAWSKAVSTVGKSSGTMEVVITNKHCDHLELFDLDFVLGRVR